ncbi:hypothetical protein RRG08_018398 [Elysia crispata]|uniref:Uncharacterized protein n=1 Tax=Elysia crispata TaxID=231223 RepID=A0AAE1DEP2_9GAST|nr:hypothetical protein RRG08_018398 [Elysia crispata]
MTLDVCQPRVSVTSLQPTLWLGHHFLSRLSSIYPSTSSFKPVVQYRAKNSPVFYNNPVFTSVTLLLCHDRVSLECACNVLNGTSVLRSTSGSSVSRSTSGSVGIEEHFWLCRVLRSTSGSVGIEEHFWLSRY